MSSGGTELNLLAVLVLAEAHAINLAFGNSLELLSFAKYPLFLFFPVSFLHQLSNKANTF